MLFKKKEKKKEKVSLDRKIAISQITMPQKAEHDNQIAEDIRLIIAEWLNPVHVPFKTRYNKRQVRSIPVISGLADQWKIKTISNFIFKFQVALLSLEGKTSKELENILSKRMPDLQQEKSFESYADKFLE